MSAMARDVVLGRIRSALGGAAPATLSVRDQGWEQLPRCYEQDQAGASSAHLDLFEERLRDYEAQVTRVSGTQVAEAIADVLAQRGNRPTLVAAGFPEHWRSQAPHLVMDDDFTARELDRFDGVLTTATLGIAQTGSLVLQNVAGQGRRAATLVPDFHLCVVRAEDVVNTVPAAFARLHKFPTLPTTFVSGPSATADIEMTRIKGVHGPRFLHVIVVEGTSDFAAPDHQHLPEKERTGERDGQQ
jgi:L-lactate dehydrogenase complex protein LldG